MKKKSHIDEQSSFLWSGLTQPQKLIQRTIIICSFWRSIIVSCWTFTISLKECIGFVNISSLMINHMVMFQWQRNQTRVALCLAFLFCSCCWFVVSYTWITHLLQNVILLTEKLISAWFTFKPTIKPIS